MVFSGPPFTHNVLNSLAQRCILSQTWPLMASLHSLNLGFLQILEAHRLAQFEACGLHTSQDVNVTTNALQCHMVRHLHREPQEFMSQEILSYLTCFMTSY